MKILLVHPGGATRGIGASWSLTFPITLPYLASLVPSDTHVEVRYLGQSPIHPDQEDDYDLVGVSSLTTHAKTALGVADRFREKGRTVVMGGIHATLFPEKALEHCDAVAIGEAEDLWPRMIEDARRGGLKRRYTCETLPDLHNVPIPRYDLLGLGRRSKNVYFPVLTSKGCPNRCEFCLVHEIFGGRLRNRPVDDVIRDIEWIVRNLNGKRIAFVDDNVIGNRRSAKELFRRLIPLHVSWCGECTLDIADDPELLDLAARSGCVQLSVGMESINPESLREVGKRCNQVERYPEQIRRIQEKRIVLVANVMFGFDHDTRQTLSETAEALIRWRVQLTAPFILRPIMGTRLFRRMEEEGRLLEEATQEHTRTDVATFVPKNMTPQELEQAYREVSSRFYSLPSILRRFLLPPTRFPVAVLLLNLLVNLRLIQWPRLKEAPLLGRLLSQVKTMIKEGMGPRRSRP